MNKLIKKLMEGLFDDFDDETYDDNDVSQLIITCEDKPKIKEWLLDHIMSKYGEPFKCEEEDDIEFYMDNGELWCDLKFKCLHTLFTEGIPDYIRINKITCRTVMFTNNEFGNLPNEIDGTLHIYLYKGKDFTGIKFPKKIGELNIVDSRIRNLNGLNTSCKHIELLNIEGCNMFNSFDGISNEVESMKLLKCNKIKNLIGIPESIDYMELVSLKKFDSLLGCPRKLGNGLYILECPELSSLNGIADLINGDCEIHDCMLYQLDMTNCRITGDFELVNNNLNDLENGPKLVDSSYIVEDKYLKRLKASNTLMTNTYNNAKFIYKVRKGYFDDKDKSLPLMSNGVKIEKKYL